MTYQAITALSHSAYPERHLGRWTVLSDVVTDGQLGGLDICPAVVDDFGDLASVRNQSLCAYFFFECDAPTEAELAAYLAFYPYRDPNRDQQHSYSPPISRGVSVCINPAPADCVIQYEAEIEVTRATRIHPADRLFDLRIGSEEPVWVTDTELRALVVAAAKLLNLSIRGRGVAA